MDGRCNFLYFLALLGHDLVEVIEKYRIKGKVVGSLNDTFIELILKGDKKISLNEYIPISLCNRGYRIITKNFSNWMKPMISKWMSKEKFGFLDNR